MENSIIIMLNLEDLVCIKESRGQVYFNAICILSSVLHFLVKIFKALFNMASLGKPTGTGLACLCLNPLTSL